MFAQSIERVLKLSILSFCFKLKEQKNNHNKKGNHDRLNQLNKKDYLIKVLPKLD